MKLHLLNRSSIGNSSFTSEINENSHFLKVWHYHPELELIVILKSEGVCFVGDHLENFKANDVFLIGKNLPHMWQNDDRYFKEKNKTSAKAITIHFKIDFLGKHFFEKPEMIHILELFERASLGMKFLNLDKSLIDKIHNMLDLEGYEKTITLLNILNKLSKHTDLKLLASQGYVNNFQSSKNKTIDRVHAYVFKNFNKEITLNEIAKIAYMNPSAFSRFYKRITRKTFTKYLAEIRIGYACKLLLEDSSSISSICYEVGFNNLSNFNRQFKIIKNCTPTEYLIKYQNL